MDCGGARRGNTLNRPFSLCCRSDFIGASNDTAAKQKKTNPKEVLILVASTYLAGGYPRRFQGSWGVALCRKMVSPWSADGSSSRLSHRMVW